VIQGGAVIVIAGLVWWGAKRAKARLNIDGE
jgi:hypothetical protein